MTTFPEILPMHLFKGKYLLGITIIIQNIEANGYLVYLTCEFHLTLIHRVDLITSTKELNRFKAIKMKVSKHTYMKIKKQENNNMNITVTNPRKLLKVILAIFVIEIS